MKIELSAHARMRALERLNINSEGQLESMAQKAMRTNNGIPSGHVAFKALYFKAIFDKDVFKICDDILYIFCKRETYWVLKTVYPLIGH